MGEFRLYEEDTIAAISTTLGHGGISVIRISGPKSHQIARNIFQTAKKGEFEYRKLYYGKIADPSTNQTLDNVLCAFMNSPNSYTGEDIVEIHSHGGYVVPQKILQIVINNGARPASPGEFTNRAFLNGKMDLTQAEAVADIINAQTEKSLKQAENQLQGNLSKKINTLKDKLLDMMAEIEAQVDFPEEDIDPIVKKRLLKTSDYIQKELKKLENSYDKGKIFKEGVYTAIIGKPNVGKSSILNAMVGSERAIVSPVPGTTRDFIEEIVDVKGIPLKIVDTAGIRQTDDSIEKIGVDLALKKSKEAEFLIVVLDNSKKIEDDDIKIIADSKNKKKIVVINKSDMKKEIDLERLNHLVNPEECILTSAKTGKNINSLNISIYNTLVHNISEESSETVLTSERHKNAIKKAKGYIESFTRLLKADESPEILSIDLRSSMDSLGKITGEVTTEDILGRIFSKFCIGK